jgi:signal recognition particle GTPase
MKSKSLLVLFVLLSSVNAKAFEAKELYGPALRYGVPCAIATAGGMFLNIRDGAEVGLVVCSSIAAAQVINDLTKITELTTADRKEFSNQISEKVSVIKVELDEQVDKAIKQIAHDMADRNIEIRKIMRELIVERLVSLEDGMKKNFQEQISRPDFILGLEAKINSKIKEEVSNESRLQNDAIVKEAVKEVLKQVLLKSVSQDSEEVPAPPKKQ